jgi:DNA-binding MarR family transcriptional regulator/GNAT superfamily N-acetyltransferase
MSTGAVAAVRDFNRFYTRVIGVLAGGLLDTDYSLTEARVIFELAQRDRTEVATLRRDLGLDAGYLSRMLARFQAAGLVTRGTSDTDGRRQVVALTGAGRDAYAVLDRRSAADIGALLQPLDAASQDRLLAAMGTVRGILTGQGAEIGYREPTPADLGWVVGRHAALYAQEYGWGDSFVALVARIVADFADGHDPARERGWIALRGGQPVGSVFCVRGDDGDNAGADTGGDAGATAKLRLLLVDPAARGLGIGHALVEECVSFARSAGYRSMTLWTNARLVAARRIYAAAGFTLVDSVTHEIHGSEETWRRAL